MDFAIATIQEKVQRLSPHKQATVIHFIDALLQDESSNEPAELSKEPLLTPTRGLAFDWIVDADEPQEPLSSVEMQHQATQWMFEMAEKNLTNK